MIILNGQSEIDKYLIKGIDSITINSGDVCVVIFSLQNVITKKHKWRLLLNSYHQEIQTKAKEMGVL